MKFKVHFTTAYGESDPVPGSMVIEADNPGDANKIVRNQYKGLIVIILKTKVYKGKT